MFLDLRRSRESFNIELLRDAVVKAQQHAIPRNLPLADELEHWFVTASTSQTELLTDFATDLKRRFRETLLETYRNRAADLAQRLHGVPHYLLLRLVWSLDGVRSGQFSGLPFEGWSEFAAVVNSAAVASPHDMLPQIATMVVRSADLSVGGRSYRYDQELAERLFGHDNVMKLFAGAPPQPDLIHEPYGVVRAQANASAPQHHEGAIVR